MRNLFLAITVIVLTMGIVASNPARSAEQNYTQIASAKLITPLGSKVMNKLRPKNPIQNAFCGQCSDDDACGGSSNGWKCCGPANCKQCYKVSTCAQ